MYSKHCSKKSISTYFSYRQIISLFHSFQAHPRGQGGLNGKILRRATTVRPCVRFDVSRLLPLWAHRPLTGIWRRPCSHRVIPQWDDLPSRKPASNTLIHSSMFWWLPAQPVWVGATQCFQSCPKHLNEHTMEGRGTERDRQLHDGSRVYVLGRAGSTN